MNQGNNNKKIYDEQNINIWNKVSVIWPGGRRGKGSKWSRVLKIISYILWCQGEWLTCLVLVLALTCLLCDLFHGTTGSLPSWNYQRILLLAQLLECARDNRSELKMCRWLHFFLLFPLITSKASPRQKHKRWSPRVLKFTKGPPMRIQNRVCSCRVCYMGLPSETRSRHILSKHRGIWALINVIT